jgi:hypothetical protein
MAFVGLVGGAAMFEFGATTAVGRWAFQESIETASETVIKETTGADIPIGFFNIKYWTKIGLRKTALQDLPNSGPIAKGVGAASKAEMLARRLKLNLNSPTTRQVLNSLDESVETFISKYRKSSVRSEIPGEYLNKTVEEALNSGNSTMRKLLTDGRYVK